MARKNLFEIAPDAEVPTESTSDRTFTNSRPLAGFEKPQRRTGPVGAISQSLGGMSEKAQRADEIEKRLAAGHAVVDLDPVLIDSSFVVDRLGVSVEDQDALVSQIRDHGQQVPILVRPNPDADGRYQVAYGHRRLAAIRKIGGPVRAVVRDLTDEQLVISQGQENNSRTDLSFIERAFFATRLEAHQFTRDVIMSSLGVDKAALSRMIALVARLPAELIESIGSAPGFGRQRWAELADLLEDKGKRVRALKAIEDREFTAASSDSRFQTIYDLLKKSNPKPRVDLWKTDAGGRAVRITENDEKLNLVFDKTVEPDFGAYVESRLGDLYGAFRQSKTDTATGD